MYSGTGIQIEEREKKMDSYSFMQWLFFFYFYCFFGWCFESAYVSLKEKHWVNRGFMRGPFLPLYGSGAIMMLVVSMPFQDNLVMVYIAGCIGATVLEYVTGVVMEAMFKVRYWDYSNQKFNFQGHICLSSSLAWGGLTILMTTVIHKPIIRLTEMIPEVLLFGIVLILTILLTMDMSLSVREALDFRDLLVRMEKIREEADKLQKRLDVVIAVADEDISNMKESVREELSELKFRHRMHTEQFGQLKQHHDNTRRRLLRNNPSMRSKRFKDILEELKEAVDERKNRGE